MLKQSLLQYLHFKIAVIGEPRLAAMSIGCPQQNAVTLGGVTVSTFAKNRSPLEI
jgi:hypothetical protein